MLISTSNIKIKLHIFYIFLKWRIISLSQIMGFIYFNKFLFFNVFFVQLCLVLNCEIPLNEQHKFSSEYSFNYHLLRFHCKTIMNYLNVSVGKQKDFSKMIIQVLFHVMSEKFRLLRQNFFYEIKSAGLFQITS